VRKSRLEKRDEEEEEEEEGDSLSGRTSRDDEKRIKNYNKIN